MATISLQVKETIGIQMQGLTSNKPKDYHQECLIYVYIWNILIMKHLAPYNRM